MRTTTSHDQVAELRAELLADQEAAEEAGYARQARELMQGSDLAGYTPVDATRDRPLAEPLVRDDQDQRRQFRRRLAATIR